LTLKERELIQEIVNKLVSKDSHEHLQKTQETMASINYEQPVKIKLKLSPSLPKENTMGPAENTLLPLTSGSPEKLFIQRTLVKSCLNLPASFQLYHSYRKKN
jgi:hypothetical protein